MTLPILGLRALEARWNQELKTLEMIMKAIATVLVALSVIAGVATAPASAFDAQKFWQEYDRTHNPAG
jgi:hypothetical protein